MRLWAKSEEDHEAIPPPADVTPILAYSAKGGEDPRVTIPAEEDISSRAKGIQVREPEGAWTPL